MQIFKDPSNELMYVVKIMNVWSAKRDDSEERKFIFKHISDYFTDLFYALVNLNFKENK